MRHHNAASQQHPACSSLPAVYLIATPSFCLLSSLSVSPSLRHSPAHPRPAQADGDCKARWRIPASQSVSACCAPIQAEERPECLPHCAPRTRSLGLCQCQGNKKNKNQRNGLERQHVIGRQTEGDMGITAGELISWECFFFFFSPPAWVRRAAMEAKWRIKFTPLQTCLSLSPLLCGEGVKSV